MDNKEGKSLNQAFDYYGRLKAFVTLIYTDDKSEFCKAYKTLTGKNGKATFAMIDKTYNKTHAKKAKEKK